MRVDARGAASETGLQPQPRGVEASRLEATVVEAPSHDGTLVPLSIVRRKGTPRDRGNPTFLQGYGAYGFSPDPFLSPSLFAYRSEERTVGKGCVSPCRSRLSRFH